MERIASIASVNVGYISLVNRQKGHIMPQPLKGILILCAIGMLLCCGGIYWIVVSFPIHH
jgi:hypothetical protein